MSAIQLRGLTKVFPNGVRAIDELDLTIADGEFFALLGPSGCGKTTLLRTIAGLELPTSGTIAIGDRDVTNTPPGRRDVAMVFQDYALFPHMDVIDNIAYPLRIKRVARKTRHAKAAETADRLGLGELLSRRPAQLSGGQQQRVALARAVAYHPQVFLFDEPLSNLDARLRLEARTFLKRLQRELGVTTVFVTHDQSEALALADRIAVMDRGRIRQLGTPAEVFQRPANTFVAAFIGSTPMNLLAAVAHGADELQVGGERLPVPASARGMLTDGEEVTYGIRPEYLDYTDSPRDHALRGHVAIMENLGSSHLVTLELPTSSADGSSGPELVQVVVPEGREPEPGSEGWAVPREDRGLVYRDGELVRLEATVPAPDAAADAPAVSG